MLSMGVAPEAMVRILGGEHSLKIFFDLYSFELACTHDVIDMITFCREPISSAANLSNSSLSLVVSDTSQTYL
jgi:hypothetical protein